MAIKQIQKYDEKTGELLSSYSYNEGSILKGGFIVVYKEALRELLKEAPNFATVKLYLNLACLQDYDEVTYTTVRFLAEESGIAYQTAWKAIKWLIQNKYVARASVNGQHGFVVNPSVSSCGKKAISSRLKHFIVEEEVPKAPYATKYVDADEMTEADLDMAKNVIVEDAENLKPLAGKKINL